MGRAERVRLPPTPSSKHKSGVGRSISHPRVPMHRDTEALLHSVYRSQLTLTAWCSRRHGVWRGYSSGFVGRSVSGAQRSAA